MWLIFSILSAIFWGSESFLHKVAAKNGLSSTKVSGIMALSASILGAACFFLFQEKVINLQFLLVIAFLNSFTFFTALITRIEALRDMDASIFFPLAKIGTLIIMIILSIFVLHENIYPVQWVGVALSIVAIYLLTWKRTKETHVSSFFTKGLYFLVLSSLFAALANFTANVASHKTGTYSFIFLSYVIGIPFSYVISKLPLEHESGNIKTRRINIYVLSLLIGTLNFLGLIMFLFAFQTGLFSIVGAITNFSILVTILLSICIYKERPTTREISGIVLAFLCLFLFNS